MAAVVFAQRDRQVAHLFDVFQLRAGYPSDDPCAQPVVRIYDLESVFSIYTLCAVELAKPAVGRSGKLAKPAVGSPVNQILIQAYQQQTVIYRSGLPDLAALFPKCLLYADRYVPLARQQESEGAGVVRSGHDLLFCLERTPAGCVIASADGAVAGEQAIVESDLRPAAASAVTLSYRSLCLSRHRAQRFGGIYGQIFTV